MVEEEEEEEEEEEDRVGTHALSLGAGWLNCALDASTAREERAISSASIAARLLAGTWNLLPGGVGRQ